MVVALLCDAEEDDDRDAVGGVTDPSEDGTPSCSEPFGEGEPLLPVDDEEHAASSTTAAADAANRLTGPGCQLARLQAERHVREEVVDELERPDPVGRVVGLRGDHELVRVGLGEQPGQRRADGLR